jgi:hypothetical protein
MVKIWEVQSCGARKLECIEYKWIVDVDKAWRTGTLAQSFPSRGFGGEWRGSQTGELNIVCWIFRHKDFSSF